MTLFSLLIIMALERVTNKSKHWHIATWCENYFSFLDKRKWVSDPLSANLLTVLVVAGFPALIVLVLMQSVPLLIAFAINLTLLWVCLGCPVTRTTYKNYLQSANREDFVACALHSENFGNHGGDLDNVGKQLVLVNYRQYVGIVIFFVLTGIAGLIFYSIIINL